MKTNLTLLIAGIVLVLLGVVFKISESVDFSNYAIAAGLLLEIIAAVGFIKLASKKN